jgi:N-acetylglucosaminyl-diphospho-decaprenol L-rhamnosyltransferase
VIYLLTVNYYSTNLVAKLISSLPKTKDIEYRIVIINNSPDDDSIAQLKSESVLVIYATSNLGFGRACNLGLKFIYAEDPKAIVWIINPDAYLLGDTLDKVNIFFQKYPQISILGTIIYTPTGKVWFAGGRFISQTGSIFCQDLLTNTDEEYVICDWVSGCSLVINLGNFTNYPEFDPMFFLYYEDFDLCLRYANQGHLIAVTKQFSVVHRPSSITNKYLIRKITNSTYSYLLTLERYTNRLVIVFRLIRLICYTLILSFIKQRVALGKLYGVFLYMRKGFLKFL